MNLEELVDEQMLVLRRLGVMHERQVKDAMLAIGRHAKNTVDPYSFDGDGRGPFIHVYPSNKQFFPFDPRPEEMCIEDIAHGLSTECRFGGHCPYYSVAEHSILVSKFLLTRYPQNPIVAMLGLLHDGPEAYLKDVPRPLKYTPPFAPFRDLEKRIQKVMYAWAGLTDVAVEFAGALRFADDTMLATEKRGLFDAIHHKQPGEDLPMPLNMRLDKWVSSHAENMFLQQYALLQVRITATA